MVALHAAGESMTNAGQDYFDVLGQFITPKGLAFHLHWQAVARHDVLP